MIVTTLPFDAAAAFTHIDAEDARRGQQAAEALGPNKAALFDALVAAQVRTVIVTFDGYGDEGQIESIDASGDAGPVALPDVAIEIVAPTRDGSGLEGCAMPVAEAVEEIAYGLLRDAHPGWENNDGAFGTFVFEVAGRTISLEHNNRYTEIDTSAHQW